MSGNAIRVCFPFVGDDLGGSHISALKLIENLDTTSFEPLIVLHQDNGKLASHLRENDLDFKLAPDVFLPSPTSAQNGFGKIGSGLDYLVRSLPKLRRYLKQEKVDILHTNDGRIHTLWSLAALGAPTRHVWHHRGDPTAKGTNLLAPLTADHIVTVSRFAKPSKPVRSIDNRWSIVHSPFDQLELNSESKVYRQRLVEELGCQKDARFLGFFGLFLDRKRPAAMADILHNYQKRFPNENVHTVIFGRPAEGAASVEESVILQRAKDLGVADRVHIMGFRVPVEPWIGAVDINLVPAVNEPFGRTLIEAMMLGSPVVATHHGGNPEAIEDGVNGFLVEAENPEAFVEPIHRLLNNEVEYRRISETARSMALENYGITKHVQQISQIYRDLLRK